MATRAFNATLIGLLAVIIWGISIPLIRILEGSLSSLVFILILYPACGLIGFALDAFKRRRFVTSYSIFKSKYFYLRALFFMLHESLAMIAVFMVTKDYLPIVILANYLWPTFVILASILIAEVRIEKVSLFCLGTIIILSSLAFELISALKFSSEIFSRPQDCLAYFLATLGALSWGLYSAFTRRRGDESGGGESVKFFQLSFLVAAPLLFWMPVDISSLLNLKILALFALIISINYTAFFSWDYGLRKGNVVVLSLGADFIPWISLFSITLIHGVAIHSHTILTVIFLVFGAIMTRAGCSKS